MKIAALILSCLLLTSCVTQRPRHIENICQIFQQYPSWFWAAKRSEQQWRMPIPVSMAIIHQESRFSATAKPPRTKLLWVIPWKRPSTSYGYTQALHDTWQRYQKSRGKTFARRDAFADAVDFIGWYANRAQNRAGILPNDTYRLYLAYHEGIGGYIKGSYRSKPWLLKVARKVNYRSLMYDAQLAQCRSRLKRKPWYRVW